MDKFFNVFISYTTKSHAPEHGSRGSWKPTLPAAQQSLWERAPQLSCLLLCISACGTDLHLYYFTIMLAESYLDFWMAIIKTILLWFLTFPTNKLCDLWHLLLYKEIPGCWVFSYLFTSILNFSKNIVSTLLNMHARQKWILNV